jgi:hypothetical protein
MMRQSVMIAAWYGGNSLNDCIAYSEHVGTKRQPGGSKGEIVLLYHLRKEIAAFDTLPSLLLLL